MANGSPPKTSGEQRDVRLDHVAFQLCDDAREHGKRDHLRFMKRRVENGEPLRQHADREAVRNRKLGRILVAAIAKRAGAAIRLSFARRRWARRRRVMWGREQDVLELREVAPRVVCDRFWRQAVRRLIETKVQTIESFFSTNSLQTAHTRWPAWSSSLSIARASLMSSLKRAGLAPSNGRLSAATIGSVTLCLTRRVALAHALAAAVVRARLSRLVRRHSPRRALVHYVGREACAVACRCVLVMYQRARNVAFDPARQARVHSLRCEPLSTT
jgi:hypothetical protein